MSSVVEALRKASGHTDVVTRVEGLERAVEAARGRLDDALVRDASEVAERATARLKLSADHTIVALAGATGSGKSSLFNDICGLDLAAVGVKRPTTSWALACAWGPEGASDILDWLGIPKRHQISRMGLLDESADDRELQGLVLLDLPDHDSTEVSHHLEVERLVKFADAMIWVLDPQKYADAAIHDRFLRPLSTHVDVMMVAFNHVDEIPADQVDSAVADVRRLLDQDGLNGVPLFATSATRGDGVDELREAIIERVAQKKFSRERLTADVRAAAARIAEQTGDGKPGDLKGSARADLIDACADAAGVPYVVDAIEQSSLRRARAATGWPVTSWLGRFRRDPLRRLHLETGDEATGGSRHSRVPKRPTSRTSLPEATPVQRARVDSAVRSVADDVTAGMSAPWADAVRQASVSRLDDVSDALDKAVGQTDLGVSRTPMWWSAVRVLQWLLFVTAVVGGLWLAALATFSFLQLTKPQNPDASGVPVPTLMLLGGIGLGVLVALACRVAARVSARRRAKRADSRLRSSIAEVTDELVVDPMRGEVEAYTQCRDGAKAALGR
jgi:GTP-binding protein EngB required for normal cell division